MNYVNDSFCQQQCTILPRILQCKLYLNILACTMQCSEAVSSEHWALSTEQSDIRASAKRISTHANITFIGMWIHSTHTRKYVFSARMMQKCVYMFNKHVLDIFIRLWLSDINYLMVLLTTQFNYLLKTLLTTQFNCLLRTIYILEYHK